MGDIGFIATLVGDGRSLLALTALVLIGSGAFCIFQAATGQFLPHDVDFLGMTAKQLCSLYGCRIVHFMIHDRVSFGGVLIAIGTMYLWLVTFPLKRGESWAWWAIAVSSGAGFLSFLAYLGYGYLDTWHGAATLALLPLFAGGLFITRKLRTIHVRPERPNLRTRQGLGRAALAAATFGIIAAGMTITILGSTAVFVPTDLEFMRVGRADIQAINAHLIPLIAHDRAGFGGALVSCGLAMLICIVFGNPSSRSLWQALAIAGAAGFATAVGIHPIIGYMSVVHVAPAVAGCVVFGLGLALARP